jgi:hypothetical protein
MITTVASTSAVISVGAPACRRACRRQSWRSCGDARTIARPTRKRLAKGGNSSARRRSASTRRWPARSSTVYGSRGPRGPAGAIQRAPQAASPVPRRPATRACSACFGCAPTSAGAGSWRRPTPSLTAAKINSAISTNCSPTSGRMALHQRQSWLKRDISAPILVKHRRRASHRSCTTPALRQSPSSHARCGRRAGGS